MRRLAKRLFWVLSVLCALALVVVWAFRIGRLSSYPFVRRLGGEERGPVVYHITSSWPAPVDPDCYFVFTQTPSVVLSAMKHDLVDKNWAVVYSDDEFATFTRTLPSGEKLGAEFQTILTKPSGYTCVVKVPRSENWFESLIGSAKKRLGIKEHIQGLDVDWLSTQEELGWKSVQGTDRTTVTATWRNRRDTNTDAKLSGVYFNGYESDQTRKITARIPAWHKQEMTLTFPRAAWEGGRLGDVAETHSYSMIGGVSDSASGGLTFLDPLVSVFHDHLGWTAVLENGAGARDLELGSCSVMTGSRKIAGFDSRILKPGDSVRIPYSSATRSGVKALPLIITGRSRLLPNKRWRSFRNEF